MLFRSVGQKVGACDGKKTEYQTCANEVRGRLQIKMAAGNRVEKQNGEEKKVNQALYLLPNRAVQCRVATHQVATQDK